MDGPRTESQLPVKAAATFALAFAVGFGSVVAAEAVAFSCSSKTVEERIAFVEGTGPAEHLDMLDDVEVLYANSFAGTDTFFLCVVFHGQTDLDLPCHGKCVGGTMDTGLGPPSMAASQCRDLPVKEWKWP